MIQIDHVTFSYGGENESAGGIQDINLNIEDGQLSYFAVKVAAEKRQLPG